MNKVEGILNETFNIVNYEPKEGLPQQDQENVLKRTIIVVARVLGTFTPFKTVYKALCNLTRITDRGFTAMKAKVGSLDQAYKISRTLNKVAFVASLILGFDLGIAITSAIEIVYDANFVADAYLESGFSRELFNSLVDLTETVIEAMVAIYASRVALLASLAFEVSLTLYDTFVELERGKIFEAITWLAMGAILHHGEVKEEYNRLNIA